MEFVREVVHDATQTLSDHHPSLIRITLQPIACSCLKNSSYLKLDTKELEVDSMLADLKLI